MFQLLPNSTQLLRKQLAHTLAPPPFSADGTCPVLQVCHWLNPATVVLKEDNLAEAKASWHGVVVERVLGGQNGGIWGQ